MSQNPFRDTLLEGEIFEPKAATVTPIRSAESNPFRDTLNEAKNVQSAQGRASVRQAVTVNPDQYAKERQMAASTGLPVDVVSRNSDEVRQRIAVQEYETLQRYAPKLAEQMRNPDFAKLAHDSVGELSKIEKSAGASGSWAPGATGRWAPERTVAGTAGDVGVTALKGAVGLPQAVVGLASIPTLGLAGKMLEKAGFRFKDTQRILDELYSPAQQAANETVRGADGFFSTLLAAVQNPSVIATTVGESLPQMLGGMGVARGLLRAAPSLSPLIAGAVGEGVIGAGSAAEQIRGQTADSELTGKQSLASVLSGVGTMVFGLMGGKLAQRFGVDDIDTALARGGLERAAVEQARQGFVRRLAQGAITEGVFEELPQSAQEQMWQNFATDRPLLEGVGNAAALGLLAGAVTGGGFSALVGGSRPAQQEMSAEQAEVHAKVLEDLTKLAAASKVRERDARSFEAFVNAAAEDGPVQAIQVNAVLFQEAAGENLAVFMQTMPSVAEQMQEALATNSELVIPLGEFTARANEIAPKLIDDLRTSPDAMTRNEAKTFMQESAVTFEKEAQRILEEKEFDTAFKESAASVENELLAQLRIANRFTDDVNAPYAKLAGAFYTVQAARLGITPEEMYVRYPLAISAEGLGGNAKTYEQRRAVRLDDFHTEVQSDIAYTVANLPAFKEAYNTVEGRDPNEADVRTNLFGLVEPLSLPQIEVEPAKVNNADRSTSAVAVKKYAEQMRVSEAPPILVRREGNRYVIVEGGHRLAAAQEANRGKIKAVDVTRLFNLDWGAYLRGAPINTLFQDTIDNETGAIDEAPPFYSVLSRKIEGAKMNVAPAAQWKAFIKPGNGITKEEIEMSGVLDALDVMEARKQRESFLLLDDKGEAFSSGDAEAKARWEKGVTVPGQAMMLTPAELGYTIEKVDSRITKQDVLDYLAENGTRVETLILGESAVPEKFEVIVSEGDYDIVRVADGFQLRDSSGNRSATTTEEEAYALLARANYIPLPGGYDITEEDGEFTVENDDGDTLDDTFETRADAIEAAHEDYINRGVDADDYDDDSLRDRAQALMEEDLPEMAREAARESDYVNATFNVALRPPTYEVVHVESADQGTADILTGEVAKDHYRVRTVEFSELPGDDDVDDGASGGQRERNNMPDDADEFWEMFGEDAEREVVGPEFETEEAAHAWAGENVADARRDPVWILWDSEQARDPEQDNEGEEESFSAARSQADGVRERRFESEVEDYSDPRSEMFNVDNFPRYFEAARQELEEDDGREVRRRELARQTPNLRLRPPPSEVNPLQWKGQYQSDGGRQYREMPLSVPTIEPYNVSDAGHFQTRTGGRTVGWSRFKIHDDAAGVPTMWIEEIQSQRAQAARENREAQVKALMKERGLTKKEANALVPKDAGFKRDPTPAEIQAKRSAVAREQEARHLLTDVLAEANAALETDYRSVVGFFVATDRGIIFDNITPEQRQRRIEQVGVVRARMTEANNAHMAAMDALHAIPDTTHAGLVPIAPFVQDTQAWTALVLKRLMRYAADNGITQIAWTPGIEQVDRYENALREQVDEIAWTKTEGGVDIVAKKNGQEYQVQQFKGTRLGDAIGPHMSQLILADPAQSGVLTGDNIKIDDRWPAGYYGDAKGLNDLGQPSILTIVTNGVLKTLGGGSVTTLPVTVSEKGRTHTGAAGFKMPPEMIEKIKGGLSLFQKERGQISFGDDITKTPSVITLLNSADLSTFVHELGHFQLEVLSHIATQPDAPAEIVADMNLLLKWFGIKGDEQSEMVRLTTDARRELEAGGAGEAYTKLVNILNDRDNKSRGEILRQLWPEITSLPKQPADTWQADIWIEAHNEKETGLARIDFPSLSRRVLGYQSNARTALDVWNAMSLDQKRPYHEQLARGFEAYLFEGRAPSIELNGVFSRMRAWMVNVYRQLTALKVTLTPEVRGVFDRLIATNEEILEAQAQRGTISSVTAEDVGATGAEWKAYQELNQEDTQEAVNQLQARSLRDMRWTTNTRVRVMRGLQREANRLRKSVEAEVTNEVQQQPVYAAQRFINANKENAAPEVLPLVAERFGFTSVDHLTYELGEAQPESEVIDAITDKIMLERHGDLASPDAISRATDKALHNEVHARAVITEHNMIAKATGSQRIVAKAAKAFADQIIARKKIRDLHPKYYSAAETRFAKAAVKAKDLAEKAQLKKQQVLNTYAARAAHDAESEIEKKLRYLKTVGTRESIDIDYRDQIDAMLERFDLRQITNKEADKRVSLAKWIEAQEARGFDPVISDELRDETTRKPYREMTVEEFRGLVDAIRNIEHLGRLKNKLLTAADQRAFDAAEGELVASIHDNAKTTRSEERSTDRGFLVSTRRLFDKFAAIHRKFASMARGFDGYKDGGVAWEYLVRNMNAAGNFEAAEIEKATAVLTKLLHPVVSAGRGVGVGDKRIGDQFTKREYFPSIGKSFSREEKIGVLLNMGNDINVERVMTGEALSPQQTRELLGTLAREDAQFVNELWAYFESFRPLMAAKERRVTGVEPEWVEAKPFTLVLNTGEKIEMRGGYYPIAYDPYGDEVSNADINAQVQRQIQQGFYTRATTRRGHLKARSESTGRRLNYAFGDVITNHVTQVIHDLAWHEYLIDANRLLGSTKIEHAVKEHYGVEVLREMKDTLKDIAIGSAHVEKGAAFWNHLRYGTTIAGLGFNVFNSLQNMTGLTQSMSRIGAKWVFKGAVHWAGDAARFESAVKEMREKSALMRERGLGKTLTRDIKDIRSKVTGETSKIEATFFWLQTKTQAVVDTPTWWGAYEKVMGSDEIMDGLTKEKAEAKAVALADQAVLDSQGGGQEKDQAGIQRGPAGLKLFTTFYSYFNLTFNLTAEAYGRTDFRKPKDIALFTADMVLLYALPALLSTLLKVALSGDWDDEEKLRKKIIGDQISFALGTVVGLRELSAGAQAAFGVGEGFGYTGPAAARFFSDAYNLGKQIHQGEPDEAFWKALNNVGGVAFHYPSGQLNRTASGIAALSDGRTDNPGALLMGAPRR